MVIDIHPGLVVFLALLWVGLKAWQAVTTDAAKDEWE